MEENQQHNKFDWNRLILPGSILIAGILISVSILVARGKMPSSGGTSGSVNPQYYELKITSDDRILGDPKAKVTIVEFADFRCPFCERFFQQAEKQLIKEYVDTGKARFVFKHYAFLGLQSVWASEAAECAAEQGKFWDYHDWLYENQASESDLTYYSKNNLIKYAGKTGLNTSQFGECLNGGKYSDRVAQDLTIGKEAGVTGTPTVIILGSKNSRIDLAYIQQQRSQNNYNISLPNGNAFIVGAQPFSTFKAAIDKVLTK